MAWSSSITAKYPSSMRNEDGIIPGNRKIKLQAVRAHRAKTAGFRHEVGVEPGHDVRLAVCTLKAQSRQQDCEVIDRRPADGAPAADPESLLRWQDPGPAG